MHNIRAGLKGTCISLSYKSDSSPFSCGPNCKLPSRIACAGVNGPFHAMTACHLKNLFQSIGSRLKYMIGQSQLLSQLNAVIIHLHANQHICPHSLCHHQGSQPYRAKAGYQYGVISADTYLLDGLIHRSEAAGYLRPILIG